MADKPSQALRAGRRNSSMWLAIEAVASGRGRLRRFRRQYRGADGDVEDLPAHHGADRPAGAGRDLADPARRSIVLDVGATIGADAQHLSISPSWARPWRAACSNFERPTVGLLNVGVEEVKGIEEVKAAVAPAAGDRFAAARLSRLRRGRRHRRGTVDVVVTEGFTGNIALKTAEGTAKQIAAYLRQAMSRNLMTKLGALIARRRFHDTARRNCRRAKSMARVFLGLDGMVIKGHGGVDADGFSGAIEIGYGMVRHGLLEKIRDMMSLAENRSSDVQDMRCPAQARSAGSHRVCQASDPT